MQLPKIEAFETGSNTWRHYEKWPPGNTQRKTIYLHANGKLSFEPPAANEAAYDQYVSDPANPVPYVPFAATESSFSTCSAISGLPGYVRMC